MATLEAASAHLTSHGGILNSSGERLAGVHWLPRHACHCAGLWALAADDGRLDACFAGLKAPCQAAAMRVPACRLRLNCPIPPGTLRVGS